MHNNFMTDPDALSESQGHHGGLSGLSEYEHYGGAGQIDYNTEIEIQERIRRYEEKMMRATMNRGNRIHDCQEKLQYQNQVVRERVHHAESSDN